MQPLNVNNIVLGNLKNQEIEDDLWNTLEFSDLLDNNNLLDQWKEYIKNDPRIQEALFEILELSKDYDCSAKLAIKAANAISLLNYAGISFSHRNLKGIHVQGARLNGIVAVQTDFQNADLRDVDFEDGYLYRANFSGANLEGVKFFKEPYLENNDIPDPIEKFSFQHIEQGSYLTGVSRGGSIIQWDLGNDQIFSFNPKLNDLVIGTFNNSNICVSSGGQFLAIRGKEKIVICNLDRSRPESVRTIIEMDFPSSFSNCIFSFSPDNQYFAISYQRLPQAFQKYQICFVEVWEIKQFENQSEHYYISKKAYQTLKILGSKYKSNDQEIDKQNVSVIQALTFCCNNHCLIATADGLSLLSLTSNELCDSISIPNVNKIEIFQDKSETYMALNLKQDCTEEERENFVKNQSIFNIKKIFSNVIDVKFSLNGNYLAWISPGNIITIQKTSDDSFIEIPLYNAINLSWHLNEKGVSYLFIATSESAICYEIKDIEEDLEANLIWKKDIDSVSNLNCYNANFSDARGIIDPSQLKKRGAVLDRYLIQDPIQKEGVESDQEEIGSYSDQEEVGSDEYCSLEENSAGEFEINDFLEEEASDVDSLIRQANLPEIIQFYQKQYPSQQDWISKAIDEICIIVNKEELLLTDLSLENFKNFLSLMFYQHPRIQHVFQAVEQREGSDEDKYFKLNLVNLLFPIVIALNEGCDWNEFHDNLKEFNEGDTEIYQTIIETLNLAFDSGTMSLGWYDQLVIRLKLENKTSIEPSRQIINKEKIAAPSLVKLGTINPPQNKQEIAQAPAKIKLDAVEIHPNKVKKIAAFPVEALKNLLKFADELNVKGILEKTHANEGVETRLYSKLKNFILLPEDSPLHTILAANLTFSLLWSKGISQLQFSNVYNAVMGYFRDPKKLALPDKSIYGKFAAPWEASNQLMEYIGNFYEGEEKSLNYDLLAITLLKDESLYNLLKDDTFKNQISELCACARIPHFNKEAAYKLISSFNKLQELVIVYERDRHSIANIEQQGFREISNLADLTICLMCHEEFYDLLPELTSLLKRLSAVVEVFIRPQILNIAFLALPRIKDIFGGKAKIQKNIKYSNKNFIDLEHLFIHDKSDELGKFLSSPVDNFMKTKTLDGYTFTHPKAQEVDKNTLCVNFEKFAFKGFSFKECLFTDLNFKDLYFENCDFSQAQFRGSIHFSTVYMDSKTASTFLQVLSEDVKNKRCKIVGIKQIIFIDLNEDHKNQLVDIPIELEELIDGGKATWVGSRIDADNNFLPVFEEPPLTLDHDEEALEAGENEEEDPFAKKPLPSKSYLNALWGGLGNVLSGGKKTTSVVLDYGLNSLKGLYSKGQKGQSLLTDNQNKISEYTELETKLKQQQKELDIKRIDFERKVNQTHAIQSKVNDHLMVSIEKQNQELENVKGYLAIIQKERKIKEAICLEQKFLLQHSRREVAAFYQTFVTDLSSIFTTILLIQNPLKLLKPTAGKLTQIANQQKKFGALTQLFTAEPKRVNKLTHS